MFFLLESLRTTLDTQSIVYFIIPELLLYYGRRCLFSNLPITSLHITHSQSLTYNTWRRADYYDNASMGHKSREKLSAETGTALNPFFLGPSVLYRPYYGRDSPVREGSAIQRQPSPSAGQAPGGGVANKDERAYIDVLSFLNSRTSNSASSSHQAVSNRRPGLRLQNTRRLTGITSGAYFLKGTYRGRPS